jgi:hypothetical protein
VIPPWFDRFVIRTPSGLCQNRRSCQRYAAFVSLALSFLFGLVGMAYFVYGKKQAEIVFMLAGGLLCFYPYFVPNLTVMVTVGLALMAAPFVAARAGWS